MFASDHQATRTRYLQALLAHYGTIALPFVSGDHAIALETVFQPLTLRQRPLLTVEDEQRERQRAATEAQTPESQPPASDEPVMARDGAEALQKSSVRRLLVLGGPGMGKTTLLKALLQQAIAAALADPAAELPLFISLPDLARSGLTLANYLPQVLAELGIESDFAALLNAAISAGRAFLCLDSLDEVLPAQRPDIIALINRQAPQYGGTWIIGSRFTENQGGQFSSGRFAEWELLPLDDLLRRQLADHLFPLLSKLLQTALPSAEVFLQALANDRHIAEWGENPLLFSLAAAAYVQQGRLPVSRAALYAAIIDVLLGLRVADPSARHLLRRQLARLALDLYQTRGRNFTARDVRELLTAYGSAASADELYHQLALILDSGVLDVVAHQTYGFKHQMFQEYLAAVALAEQLLNSDERIVRAAWDFIQRKRTYSRWREILRLLVGVLVQEHESQGSRLAADWLQYLASVRATVDSDPGNLCLLLALSSLQEFPSAEHSPQMTQAIRELLVLWAEAFVEALVKKYPRYHQVDDEHSEVHRRFERLERSVEEIQRLNLSLVLPALVALEQAFEQAKTLDVLENAEKKFADFLQTFALSIPARVLILAFPEPRVVDLSTIVTARRLDVALDVAALIELLENPHESWQARVGAARLLTRVESSDAYFALNRVLFDADCFYRVREVAAEAPGWRGGPAAVAALMQAAQDPDERIRLAAVKAMGKLGADMPVQELLTALRDTGNIRWEAIEALKQLKEPHSLRPLLLALDDDSADVRAGSLAVLDSVQEQSSCVPVESIIPLLNDPDYDVHLRAVHLLGKYADTRVLPPLLAALHDATPKPRPHEDIRAAAVASLLQLHQRVPVVQAWVIAEHIEQALQEKYFGYYCLLELVYTLRIPLSTAVLDEFVKSFLVDLQESFSVYKLEQKLQYLQGIGAHIPITRLLEMLSTSRSDAQKNIARALLSLHQIVPAEPIIAWMQRVDLSPDAHSFYARKVLAETYMYLAELLVRQGKELDSETLFSILGNADTLGGVEESFTRICGLLRAKAPVARLLDMLSEASRSEQCVRILSNFPELLTPELIRAGAAHRYNDEVMAIEVLGVMQEEAPIELLLDILKDEARADFVRVHALFALHELGVAVPLEYFVLGQDWCIHGVDNSMIESMTRLGEQAPIPELVELLGYGNNWVRSSAGSSLQNLVEYVPIELMLAALENPNAIMREEAALALRAFGERAPVAKLLAMVRDTREALRARRAALATLAELNVRVPIELLLRLIQLDDYNMRQAVFRAFEVWGKDVPLDVILQLLDDAGLRSDAIEVLGSMAENAPVDLLLSFIDNEDEEQAWISSHAASALARLGKHAPLEEMIARLYDKDGEMRRYLIDAFGEMGEYAPIDVILKALDSDNPEIRHEADLALFCLSDDAPARLVAEARADPRPLVRKRVLDALVKLGQDAPIELALAALADQETRGDALYALIELNVDISTRMSRETFLRLLHFEDEDHELNWQELELLEQFGEPIPVELLLSEMGAGSSEIAKKLYKRYPAVFREVVAPQAEAILRGEPVGGVFASRVQSRIATMIGQIGCAAPDVLAMVVDLLDWPFERTRLEAVRALGAIHRNIPDRAIRRLLELRHDPRSAELRAAADAALAEILAYENGMEEEA